ncbi:MAG: hypothetical protein ISS77_08080 [Phycisphaerae bacterium]|nr:hypothetical protein [Phycisphaerae bacterium]
MKAEHRHELKTNELAQWLADFPQWLKNNAKMVTYISFVVIVVAAAYFYKTYTKDTLAVQQKEQLTYLISTLGHARASVVQAQAKGMDTSFNLIQIANKLQDFAKTATDDKMAALAYLKSAQAIRQELQYRPKTVDTEELALQINNAKGAYQNALQKANGDATLTSEAKLGIALCHEDLSLFPQAQAIYKELTQNPDYNATTAAAKARIRLETFAQYKTKPVFAPAPEPLQQDTELQDFTFDLPQDAEISPNEPDITE